ncbi:hypothetical protein BDQ12DRAFT_668731 [Crucibulum laeve]|uniref:Integral membrane protein n=1 Tax=Crucibulum laeve TaxID=68775 RepID=A0A5C3LT20_9AGAR|nr:hypothetical protein BDQ12DRAFT_668731 [Crucibulum laeve]
MIPEQPFLPWKDILVPPGYTSTSQYQSEHARHLKVVLSYLNQTCFGLIIWWSRISLALAVIRITPVWSKTRPWVICLICAFILNCLTIILGMTVTCAVNTNWQHMKADIIGDLLLVGFPLYRLWYIKLQPAQHRLVLLVFSTSVLTLVAVVAVATVSYGRFFKGPGALLVWLMMLNVEEAVSVIACNLPVLVSWGYRVFSRNDEDASGDHITPHWSRVVPGGFSTPTFVLPDLSGSRSQASDNVVQLSASELSLVSQMGAQRKEDDNGRLNVTEDVPNTSLRKDIIV